MEADAGYLRKCVLATVAYYDVSGLPLTAFEVWKYLTPYDPERPLGRRVGYLAVVQALEAESISRVVHSAGGMYFLAGRGKLVAERSAAEKISLSKLKRLSRLARVLAAVPFVRMIAVSGSLAQKRSDPTSDWDIFVVLRGGRIWGGRTLLTLLLHLLRKRRHGRFINDRVCLNYFVTDTSLMVPTRDLFAAHEYRRLYPLCGREVAERFERRNGWIAGYQPNYSVTMVANRLLAAEGALALFLRRWGEQLYDWADRVFSVEARLARFERERILRNPKTAFAGSWIVADDTALIFLPRPQSPRVFAAYRERLAAASIQM